MKTMKKLSSLFVLLIIMLLSVAITASATSYPESDHNYANSMDKTWTYTHPDEGVDGLKITFSSNTQVENGYDYIYIYTLDGTWVGGYSGTTLAGATVEVAGNGFQIRLTSDGTRNYYGFKIDNIAGYHYANLSNCIVTIDELPVYYNGSAQEPALTVQCGASVLTQGTDYTVSYTNNINIGTATATITGAGYCSGTVVKTFEILPLDLATTTVIVEDQVYTGSALEPAVAVSVNGVILPQSDYVVAYTSNTKVGTATVEVTANSQNCTGSVVGNFKVLMPPYPESDHNYANDTNKTWTYIYPETSAASIRITFSSETCVESGYDYIYIYTLDDALVGKYTGTTLAGAMVTVPGSGFKIRLYSDYTGTRYGFKITDITEVRPVDLSECTITIDDSPLYYNGSAREPVVTVQNGYSVYTQGIDYTVSYTNNVNAGTATATITGNGFCSGTVVKTFEILPLNLATATVTVEDQAYTGSALKPAVTVSVNGYILPTSEYKVSYSSNTDVGTAKVTISPKTKNFTGKATGNFAILAPAYPESSHNYANYTNQTWTYNYPKTGIDYIKVTFSSDTCVENKYDKIYIYTLDGTLVGEYTGTELAGVTITVPDDGFKIKLTSDYTGTRYGFKITNITAHKYVSLSKCTITLSQTSAYCTGSAIKPSVTVKYGTKTLKKNTDYTVSYSNNVNAGTAKVVITGKGNYNGKVTKTFTIKQIALSKCTIKLAKTSVDYTGKAQTPAVTVKYGSTTLKKDKDYKLTYSANKNAGTAKVKITGLTKYSGSITKTFKIKPLKLSKLTITKIATQNCTGSAVEPKIEIKNGSVVIPNSNFTIKYSSNVKAGTATVTITPKGENVTGSSKKITFKLVPALSYTKKNMYKGKSFTLELFGVPVKKVKFSSSKKSVCTVSSKGVVKAKKAGKATISAKYNGKTYKCTVTVLATASSNSSTKYYKNHDDVPDFGALVKIEPTSTTTSDTNGDTFLYSLSDLQKVDPDQEAGTKYKKLLVKNNFELKSSSEKIDGKYYYKYVSEKKIVYFGIAKKNGEVKIIIKKA